MSIFVNRLFQLRVKFRLYSSRQAVTFMAQISVGRRLNFLRCVSTLGAAVLLSSVVVAPLQAKSRPDFPWSHNDPNPDGSPRPQPTPDRTPEPTPQPTPRPTPDRTPEPTPRPTATPRPTPNDDDEERRERQRLERERERRRAAEAQLQYERYLAQLNANEYQNRLSAAQWERDRLQNEAYANASDAEDARRQAWQAQQDADALRDQQNRDAQARAEADAQRQADLQSTLDALRTEREQLEAQRIAFQTDQQRALQQQKEAQDALKIMQDNATLGELQQLKREIATLRAAQVRQNAKVPAKISPTPTFVAPDARRWPNFSRNISGVSVGALQQLLRAQGLRLNLTNRFDASTQRAVRQFQFGQNLNVSGRTDNATWETLIALSTNKTEAIRAAQTLLERSRRASGSATTFVAANGVFNPTTRSAVARFQKMHQLPAGGNLNASTWCLLFGGTLQPRL